MKPLKPHYSSTSNYFTINHGKYIYDINYIILKPVDTFNRTYNYHLIKINFHSKDLIINFCQSYLQL